MKLGIGSYTYTWAVGVPGSMPAQPLGYSGLLERAAALGVKVVQYADNLPLEALADGELRALARQAQELGIQVEVGTRGIEAGHLRRFVEIAGIFGAPFVRVVIDTAEQKPSAEDTTSLLYPLREAFSTAGIRLVIENHDRFSCRTLARLVETLGSDWVGICLDTVNSLGALEGTEEVVRTLGRFAVNLHVKDYTVTRLGHRMGFLVEGRPAGQGRLDVPWLLSELRRLGRDPNAILELWTPPEERLEDTIAKEARWAEDSVAYLRTLIKD
jgi:sugar phosphate isomerase/epimerase